MRPYIIIIGATTELLRPPSILTACHQLDFSLPFPSLALPSVRLLSLFPLSLFFYFLFFFYLNLIFFLSSQDRILSPSRLPLLPYLVLSLSASAVDCLLAFLLAHSLTLLTTKKPTPSFPHLLLTATTPPLPLTTFNHYLLTLPPPPSPLLT